MSISRRDDSDGGPRRAPVPAAAAWLGGLGLVPFVGLSIASQAIGGDLKTIALQGLLAYGAIILSILGGVHWGATMTRSIAQTDHDIDARMLGISVVPSLVGWASLLMDPRYGLALLVVGFAANLLLDIRSAGRSLVPPWYCRLRRPLTLIVVIALVTAEFSW